MSDADIRPQVQQCQHWLDRGEQAARVEAWDSLPRIHHAYFEAFDQLRALLGDGPVADDATREQLAELERRQRRLVYEFRKGQSIIKARLEDLQVARQRLGRFSSPQLPLFGGSASVDRSV